MPTKCDLTLAPEPRCKARGYDEQDRETTNPMPWICTRELGHSGAHHAHTEMGTPFAPANDCCYVWEDES